jgi:prolipoprotein diacylglyceryltransferase
MFSILFTYYAYHENLRKKYAKGSVFWMFILIYGILRFIITFYRDEPVYHILGIGLNVGQWLSLLMVIAAIIALWKIKPKNI